MKISPMGSSANVVSSSGTDAPQASSVQTLRALKMSTNATPGAAQPLGAQELSISDDNEPNKDQVNQADEATQPISPQFAALARERRAIQREKQLLAQEKAAFAASQGSDDVIPKARLKSETLKVLEEAGVTYDDLTEAILAGQGNPEMRALEAKIKSLEEGVEKRFVDQRTQEEQAVLSEMKREASQLASMGDTFELVRETQSVPYVIKLIERTYRESGEVLDVTEAMQLVEDHLFEQNQKLVGLKKMQGLFKPAEPAPAQQRPQGMRTLSNKHTASVPADRKARALAAFHGTQKK